MTFDDFMSRLLELQTTLITMPEEITLTESFQQEQDNLQRLLERLTDFTEEEQAQARVQMQAFADQLNEKLIQLEQRVEGLKQNMDNSHLRLKGLKAYARGKMM